MYNHYNEQPAVPFFIRDVVGVARQIKKYIIIRTYTHTKTFLIIFSTYDVSEDFFEQVAGNK